MHSKNHQRNDSVAPILNPSIPMIFVEIFSSEIKTMSSIFMKSIYIYNILYHFVH